MKRKITAFTIVILMLAALLPVNVFAYIPPYEFDVDVNTALIPENAVYVDFLLPIEEDDECYVDFNKKNGTKYSISKDSQIANYSEDGFVSYTFHMADAYSEMRPYYTYYLTVYDEAYEKNKELLDSLSETNYSDFGDGRHQFFVTVKYKTADEKIINEIHTAVNQDLLDLSKMKASFNHYNNTYDYEYCCKNYKKAKVAYLDELGNVLFVSEEFDIYKWSLSPIHIYITLSGEEVEYTIKSGPPWFIVPIILGIQFIAMLVLPIIVIIKLVKRKKHKASLTETPNADST